MFTPCFPFPFQASLMHITLFYCEDITLIEPKVQTFQQPCNGMHQKTEAQFLSDLAFHCDPGRCQSMGTNLQQPQ